MTLTKRNPSGFTLIELLVVIAIIAILAAILFPVLMQAKAAANQSTCSSNMGQLARAFASYSADYQGKIPDWWVPTAGYPWDRALYAYVKNPKIFSCPINRMNPATNQPWKDASGKMLQVRSYAIPKNVAAQIVEQVPKPSMTVLLLEKGSQPLFSGSDACAEWFTQTYGYNHDAVSANSDANPIKYWHKNGKNFAFVDGHAKYYKYPNGPFAYDYPNFRPWSTDRYPNNTNGPGYCGYADQAGAGGGGLPGANMPR